MKKFYQLLITQLKVSTRNRSALFFTMIFPLVFMGVFGLAFQEGDPANTTITIGLINNDQGIPDNANVFGLNGQNFEGKDLSNQFVDILKGVKFQDNTTNIFEIEQFTSFDDAESKVKRQIIKALVIIPEDFSLGYMAAIRSAVANETLDWDNYPNSDYTTQIEIIGDNSLVQFNIVFSVIGAVTEGYFSIGDTVNHGEISIQSTITSEGLTTFDMVVPGLVIFAIIANANTVAAVALNDVESKMLDRMRLTKISKWEYPTALVTSQIIVSLVQIPLLFGSALIFGFPFTPQLFIAFGFAIFVSMAMSGIGMLMAGFFSNAESAGALASIITTPMAFLAGAFFTMPNPQILPGGVIGESPLGVFDLLPPTRSITALRLVIANDYTLSQVLPDLFITMVLAVIYLSIGIFVYSKKHLQVN